jgi:predicted HD phosphohydrolase
VTSDEADARIESLLALLERARTSDYIGEGVSQLDHALQAAAAARAASAPPHEVLAALLHDVGHLCAGPDAPSMEGLGVVRHEELGAAHLAALGFGDDVVALVRGHVAAKRYLVGSDPAYAARLSAASRGTLRHQGGPMTAAEQRAFEALPIHRSLLRVRSWDEAAKDPERNVPGLASYAVLLRDHLLGR